MVVGNLLGSSLCIAVTTYTPQICTRFVVFTAERTVIDGYTFYKRSTERNKDVEILPSVEVAIVSLERCGSTSLAGSCAQPLAFFEEFFTQCAYYVVNVVSLLVGIEICHVEVFKILGQ